MKVLFFILHLLLINTAVCADDIHKTIEEFSSITSEPDRCAEPNAVDPICSFEGVTEEWKAKCNELALSGKIPRGALEFTLNAMAKNSTEFGTDKCFNKHGLKDSSHYSMGGTKAKDIKKRMKNGLSNKCTFIINDMETRWRGPKYSHQKCLSRMYYVDLCSDGAPKVKETIVKQGTGTCAKGRGYQNKGGRGTTLLGAFVTNHKVFSKNPGPRGKAKYNAIKAKIKKESGKSYAYSVSLFGLQNSNNRSSNDLKYLHVSPHESSLGCPSVDWQDWWIIDEMTKKGPSLVVNYHEGKMEDLNKCSK